VVRPMRLLSVSLPDYYSLSSSHSTLYTLLLPAPLNKLSIKYINDLCPTTLMHSPVNKTKGRAIPVTGRGGPYGCETSTFPYFLDNRLTDGGEVVSLTPQDDSWYSFLLEAESTPRP
jgi:hypothetical protein